MVFCPNCGLENNDSAKFCKNCGSSLKANSPIKDDYVATGNDPTARVNNSNLNNSNNGIDSSKSDNKNLIIICLTIVICAMVVFTVSSIVAICRITLFKIIRLDVLLRKIACRLDKLLYVE